MLTMTGKAETEHVFRTYLLMTWSLFPSISPYNQEFTLGDALNTGILFTWKDFGLSIIFQPFPHPLLSLMRPLMTPSVSNLRKGKNQPQQLYLHMHSLLPVQTSSLKRQVSPGICSGREGAAKQYHSYQAFEIHIVCVPHPGACRNLPGAARQIIIPALQMSSLQLLKGHCPHTITKWQESDGASCITSYFKSASQGHQSIPSVPPAHVPVRSSLPPMLENAWHFSGTQAGKQLILSSVPQFHGSARLGYCPFSSSWEKVTDWS